MHVPTHARHVERHSENISSMGRGLHGQEPMAFGRASTCSSTHATDVLSKLTRLRPYTFQYCEQLIKPNIAPSNMVHGTFSKTITIIWRSRNCSRVTKQFEKHQNSLDSFFKTYLSKVKVIFEGTSNAMKYIFTEVSSNGYSLYLRPSNF